MPDTTFRLVSHPCAERVMTGIEEAIASIHAVEKAVGIKDAHFELLAIAADGNRVLTERRDRFHRADGSEIGAAMVMGIFEVEGDHIVASSRRSVRCRLPARAASLARAGRR